MRFTCLVSCAGITLLGFSANAQTSSPLDPIYACASIADNDERLACYDSAVGRAQQAENEGEFRTVTRDEAYEMQEESFGLSLKSITGFKLPSFGGKDDDRVKRNEEGEITDITLEIADISKQGYDKVYITFANGQRWYQTDSTYVRWSRKSKPTSATITTGALNSYTIRLNTGEKFKAKRAE